MILKGSYVLFSRTIIRFYSIVPNEQMKRSELIKSARKIKNLSMNKKEHNSPFLGIFNSDVQDSENNVNVAEKWQMMKKNSFKFWYEKQQRDNLIWDQRFITERHETLGCQLATTHFVLYRNGRIKMKGADNYLNKDDLDNIPQSYYPNWEIEEIEMNNSDICYEGLDNFKNLPTLRKISFRGCQYFDNWCLEKIMANCPDIQYIDVCDCENINEGGIEGLYRSQNLKKLVVTDYGHGAAFELTCLMLEDCVPGLEVEIIKNINSK